ncbi:hypothetical protein TWF225_002369 [Orbilia oligospora]|nr:hypothetical protein TWF225_002369 [Orbilia oligospora]
MQTLAPSIQTKRQETFNTPRKDRLSSPDSYYRQSSFFSPITHFNTPSTHLFYPLPLQPIYNGTTKVEARQVGYC